MVNKNHSNDFHLQKSCTFFCHSFPQSLLQPSNQSICKCQAKYIKGETKQSYVRISINKKEKVFAELLNKCLKLAYKVYLV